MSPKKKKLPTPQVKQPSNNYSFKYLTNKK